MSPFLLKFLDTWLSSASTALFASNSTPAWISLYLPTFSSSMVLRVAISMPRDSRALREALTYLLAANFGCSSCGWLNVRSLAYLVITRPCTSSASF